MGTPSPVRFRRTATVVATGMLTLAVSAALPVLDAFADGQITQSDVTSVTNDGSRAITFTTSDSYLSSDKPTVTLTRSATRSASSPDTIKSSTSSANGHSVTAGFDFTSANTGLYDVSITGATSSPPSPSTTDSCQACLTVTSPAPTVLDSQVNMTSADFQYPDWVIHGRNYAKGPYTQCTALPCSTTSPNVAIFDGTKLDPDVTLAQSSDKSVQDSLYMALTIARTDTGGNRTIVVTNSDGQTGSCQCLHIAPAMNVTSISPPNLPAGTTGAEVTVLGANFPSDVQPTFLRSSDHTTTGDIAWTSMTWNGPSSFTLHNVAVSSDPAAAGNHDLRLATPANHAVHTFPGVFAIGGQPPAAPTESAPSNVTASGGDQQAFVRWTPPPSGNSDPITGYVVKTLPNGDPQTPAPASANSATVGPLTNGQSYTFTVTVTYQSGHSYTSPASNPATPSGRPSAPTGVTATGGDQSATVRWQPSAQTNGSAIQKYVVTSSPDGIQATVLAQGSTPPPTTATVKGLTNGTAYTFTVVAHNAGGDSQASDPSNSVTPIGDPSLTLHARSPVAKGTKVTLHGRLISSNGDPVAGATIKLRWRVAGAATFTKAKLVKTSAHGRYSLVVKVSKKTRFRAHWGGDVANNAVRTVRVVKVKKG